MKKAFTLFAAILLMGRTRTDHTIQTLEDQGYTDIVITGWRPFAASEDDTFATGFEAKSPAGKKVTGVVCGGFLKGSTIRLD